MEQQCLETALLMEFIEENCHGAPKGVIFDCDGVLIDSVEANMLFYNTVRKKLGLPELNAEQREYCQMSTAAQALEYITPPALHSAMGDVVRKMSYARDIEPMIQASEHIITLLKALKGKFFLGVHTNRTGPLDYMFNRLKMSGYFDPVMTVMYCEPKPSPDGARKILQQWGIAPHEALFIGDSLMDMQAAKAAGIPFLSYRNDKIMEKGTCCDFSKLEKALLALRQENEHCELK